ncbi:MAG: hypothetical protein CME80_08290 [Halomonas sp.]|nr:hypothetical protein [Halomonas sp.]MBF57702.1 hypothetical protein [Halomonas sp.]|tara:strand:+ start:287 stop:616 length:330 start_codon:yes stop_codon:yes gene_type:complete
MKNLDQPANATYELNGDGVLEDSALGFTKRERACIDLRIPESGDAELDALIEKARRQEVAVRAMEAIMVNAGRNGYKHMDDKIFLDAGRASDSMLDELDRLSRLERTDG